MNQLSSVASVPAGSRAVIAGAGGFGREVHAWLEGSTRFLGAHSISDVVFIDDSVPTVPPPAEVISTISGYVPEERDLVICAVGDPSTRRKVVALLEDRGARLLTFIDDRAVLGAEVTLGEGVVICPGVIITSNVTLGDHVHVNINCSVGHDVTVGDYVTLSPACNLMGGVVIADGVFLGTAATVIPGQKVGRGSVVGAGSIVIRSVPDGVTSFGNPSRTSTKNVATA